MPRLSVIIPVLGNPAQMEDTLVAVLANRSKDCEIVVVLNRHYDDPYDLKDEVRFVEGPRDSSLIDLINIGVGLSRAAVVQLLPCGVQTSEGWAEAALARFQDAQVAAVVPMVVDRHEPQKVLAAGVIYGRRSGSLRRLASGMSATDATARSGVIADPQYPACFYRRAALEQVGRFSNSVGQRLAVIDVAMALAERKFRSVLEPGARLFATPKPGGRRSAFTEGKRAEQLYRRWLPRNWRFFGLAMHGLVVAGEFAKGFWWPSTVARLAGRILGYREAARAEREGQDRVVPTLAPQQSRGVPPPMGLHRAGNRQQAGGKRQSANSN